ncbi:hypothetical protein MTO96_021229 [Rhipicephalus appendiculatus]
MYSWPSAEVKLRSHRTQKATKGPASRSPRSTEPTSIHGRVIGGDRKRDEDRALRDSLRVISTTTRAPAGRRASRGTTLGPPRFPGSAQDHNGSLYRAQILQRKSYAPCTTAPLCAAVPRLRGKWSA